jgi:c(7)-type cytochrome triheme protein
MPCHLTHRRTCALAVAWVLALLVLAAAPWVAAQTAGVLPRAASAPPLPAVQQPASNWTRLEKDGLHDPQGPGIALLQQPGDALQYLPRDTAGNLVRWVQALEWGVITPRSHLRPETEVRLREDELIVAKNGSMPAVKFPHRAHTLWLDCSNCHEALFKSKLGANGLRMTAILNGEQCGLCHGAVSFPLTECNRCHSVPNASLRPPARAVVP